MAWKHMRDPPEIRPGRLRGTVSDWHAPPPLADRAGHYHLFSRNSSASVQETFDRTASPRGGGPWTNFFAASPRGELRKISTQSPALRAENGFLAIASPASPRGGRPVASIASASPRGEVQMATSRALLRAEKPSCPTFERFSARRSRGVKYSSASPEGEGPSARSASGPPRGEPVDSLSRRPLPREEASSNLRQSLLHREKDAVSLRHRFSARRNAAGWGLASSRAALIRSDLGIG